MASAVANRPAPFRCGNPNLADITSSSTSGEVKQLFQLSREPAKVVSALYDRLKEDLCDHSALLKNKIPETTSLLEIKALEYPKEASSTRTSESSKTNSFVNFPFENKTPEVDFRRLLNIPSSKRPNDFNADIRHEQVVSQGPVKTSSSTSSYGSEDGFAAVPSTNFQMGMPSTSNSFSMFNWDSSSLFRGLSENITSRISSGSSFSSAQTKYVLDALASVSEAYKVLERSSSSAIPSTSLPSSLSGSRTVNPHQAGPPLSLGQTDIRPQFVSRRTQRLKKRPVSSAHNVPSVAAKLMNSTCPSPDSDSSSQNSLDLSVKRQLCAAPLPTEPVLSNPALASSNPVVQHPRRQVSIPKRYLDDNVPTAKSVALSRPPPSVFSQSQQLASVSLWTNAPQSVSAPVERLSSKSTASASQISSQLTSQLTSEQLHRPQQRTHLAPAAHTQPLLPQQQQHLASPPCLHPTSISAPFLTSSGPGVSWPSSQGPVTNNNFLMPAIGFPATAPLPFAAASLNLSRAQGTLSRGVQDAAAASSLFGRGQWDFTGGVTGVPLSSFPPISGSAPLCSPTGTSYGPIPLSLPNSLGSQGKVGGAPKRRRQSPNEKDTLAGEPKKRKARDPATISKVQSSCVYIMKMVGTKIIFEKEIRGALGNNPDTSKALRLLMTQGKLLRTGAGGRGDPFSYRMTALGLQECAGRESGSSSDSSTS